MCGIFGIVGHAEATKLTYLGLHALQHRGQESAGISASDAEVIRTYRGVGLVADVFDGDTLGRLSGQSAIGHVRYSTAGGTDMANAQPLAVRYHGGHLAMAHNGNLVNAGSLREALEQQGAIFGSNADSEVFVHLFSRSTESDDVSRLRTVLREVKGAYSLLVLTPERLIAARDPYGFRPLVMGRLRGSGNGDSHASAWAFASESCAFSLIGATYERSVQPGELVVVDGDGCKSYTFAEPPARRFCVFEHIYFARPDSVVGGQGVYNARRRLGERLAAEQPVPADVVIPVPDSGTTAALGYANAAGIPFEMGLVRSHYIGRTFIEPQQAIRHFGVKLKLAPVEHVIKDRRVVVVDDSLVRGTTSRKIVAMIRAAGAKEVHLRISSPPTAHPCFYGIDIPTKEELIASTHSVAAIRDYTGCDSLGYLSLDGMLAALSDGQPRFCHACFSGDYALPIEAPTRMRALPFLSPRPRAYE